jgi:hypothetical protein
LSAESFSSAMNRFLLSYHRRWCNPFSRLPMTREGAEISAGATAESHRQA